MCLCFSFLKTFLGLLKVLVFFHVLSPNFACAAELRITNAQGLISFSNNVNNGNTYSGTTVFLDADLDFSNGLSGSFQPIGRIQDRPFTGTFDGQGHTISNLVISPSSYYAGLFGISKSIVIKNVVVDSSCSFTSYLQGTENVCFGGIIGWVASDYVPTLISSVINMASATFRGTITNSKFLFLGGIAGHMTSSIYDITVRNCANYGALSHYGSAIAGVSIGGIASKTLRAYSASFYIQNCLNYGSITSSETAYVGGIIGQSEYTTLTNCVSTGRISSSGTSYIGTIVGYPYSQITITNCPWTSNVGYNNIYGTGIAPTASGSSLVTASSTIANNLNSYASAYGWNRWIFNTYSSQVYFRVYSNKVITLSSQLILLPSLTGNEKRTFNGWFTNSAFTSSFTQNTVSAALNLYGGWNYVVTFNSNGGGTPSPTSKNVMYYSTYGTLATVSRTGYSFAGWYTAASGGTKIETNTNVAITGPQTLYAHWTANPYTISFNSNGGNTPSPTSKSVNYDSNYGTLATVSRTGYSFTGWYTSSSGGNKIETNTKMTKASAHTLYAHWSANTYTVTFSSNGGNTPSPTSKSIIFGNTYSTLATVSRTGYTFAGWYTAASGGNKIETNTKMTTAYSHTLYAHWTANPYTVSFNSNGGGTPSPTSKSVNYDSNYGTLATVSRTGYSFTGWYTSGGTKIETNTKMTTASAHTLYAHWSAIAYTVTFDKNGGNTPSKASMSVAYDSNYGTLASVSRTGYSFTGWYTSGGTKIETNTKMTTASAHTLYAHWSANTYKVTFDSNGGNTPSLTSTNVVFDSTYGTLATVTRTGYTFIGWFTEKTGGTEVKTNTKMTTASTQALYAHWSPNPYKVTFDTNGGNEPSPTSKNVMYDSAYGDLATVSRTGYTFTGWYTAASGGTKIETNTEMTTASSHTLYAHWSANTYTVTFDTNGGNEPSKATIIATYDSPYGDLATASKAGYNLEGWYTEKGDKVDANTKVATPSDHVLTARWAAKQYIVTFDKNGGDSLAKESMAITFDSPYGDLPVASKAGYNLEGWYTEEGDKVDANTKVTTPSDHVLTARWAAKQYIVTFDKNGGYSLAKENMVIIFDSPYGDLPEANRTGHTFIGWFTVKGDKVETTTKVTTASNHTLYANWIINSYDLTFDFNNGTAPEVGKVEYNSKITYPSNPTKRGSSFDGWDKKISTMPAEDVTITAQWTINNYKLGFTYCDGSFTAFGYDYNEAVEYPKDTERAGYTFNSWNKEITKMPASHTNVTAQCDINSYNAIFVFGNGEEDEVKTFKYKEAVKYPENPVREGHTFNGWDKEISTMVAEDATITAQWKINQYNLTFIFNNSAENEVRTLDFNEKIVYPESVEKTGYTFNGWNNKPARMPAENITVTAHWTINQYTLIFDFSNGDGLEKRTLDFNETIIYPQNVERTGYSFYRWDNKPDRMPAENITITALWTAKVYTVFFEAGDGNPLEKDNKTVSYDEEYGDLPTATRTGYTFVGWFTEEKGGEEVKSEDIVKITEDKTLYAHWNINQYTITFEVDGGSECKNITQEYDTEVELPKPTKTGYTFNCWCSDPELSREYTETTMPAGNVTLYAKWKVNQYTLIFIFNNDAENEVRTLDFNEEIVYPEGVEKTGYTFNGWDNKPDRMPAENITITAQWTANKYIVTFDVSGGNVLPESESKKEVTYDEEYGELPEGTRTGYTFGGWFTEEIGGTNTTSDDIVKITASQTLYAHWVARVYVVTFDGDWGDTAPPTKEVTYGSLYGDFPEARRFGYTFIGWFTEVDGGDEVKGEDVVKITKDKTLYAHWSINKYTITFEEDGGSECENITQDYNTIFVLPEPTKTGYTFDCWCSDPELSREYTETTMPAEDVTLYAKWTINQYNLTFVFNNDADNEVRTLDFNEEIDYPDNVEKTGYTFNGWDNKPDRMPAENITITAQWTANKYSVTFDVNGGNVLSEPESKKEVTFDENYGGLPEATRTGYTFGGWFTGATEGDEVTSKTHVTVAGDHTLHAHWMPNNYTVTFNPAGGSTPQKSKQVTYDSTYGDLPMPTRAGYGFSGWFTEEEGRGKQINPNTVVDITEDQVLYANWTAGAFAVAFNATGGVSSESSRALTYDGAYGELPTATRTGHTFLGWFTEDVGGEKVEADTTIRTAVDHTLYAHWEVNKYGVRFEGNGGTPSQQSKEVTFDEEYGELPEATRTGYTFTGWFTEETRGTNITSEDIVKITTNQTLHAHWTANVYTVKFEGNEGTPSKPSMEVTFDEEYGDLPSATRTGYTFIGWFTEVDGGDEVKSEDIVKITGDKTLYAHWSINQYTITFEVNAGSECKPITQDYNTEVVLPEPAKTGYTFDCWCSDPELSREYTETTMPAGDVILYAKWTINQYNLTFIFSNDADNEVRTLDYNSEIVYPEGVEKIGYTFNGWDNKPDRMPAENITITAQWTANKYTVTFDVSGGNDLSEAESKREVTYDSTYGDLPETTRTGYSFLGWFTEETCGDNVTSEDIVKIIDDKTLYCHWTANIYTVTFDVNGGNALSESESEKDMTYDSTYGDLPEPTRTGFTFVGWFTDKTFTNGITSESIVAIPNDHTLYAKWTADGYLLTFVFDNGTEPEERSLNYNDPITYPAEPVKEGHSFKGWNDTIGSMPSYDLTITAQWTVNNYKVTFDFNNGSESNEVAVEFGKEILYPAEPVKEGHTFNGWSETIEFMPARNITITAQWIVNNYTLRFDFNNGGDFVIEEVHPFNDPIEYPKEFVKEGYSFDKWDSNITFMPAHDLTITALWSINHYRLVLNFVNGSEPEVRHIAFNDPIEYPEGVEKEGHTFNGWDNVIERMPSYDLTATAQWTVNSYTLTFIFDNGDDVEVRSVQFNEMIVYPECVEKEGHTFIGWNDNITFMPTHDLTITALWSINEYEVTFDFGNGTAVKETVQYDEPITYPEDIDKEGYKFSGWKPKPRTMPANDLVTKAQWSEDIRSVEITLGTSDLSESEIIELLKKYTESDFTIDRIEFDKSGGSTQIIIRFEDSEEASKFIGKVNDEIKGGESTYFEGASLFRKPPGSDTSYSHHIKPFLLFLFVFDF